KLPEVADAVLSSVQKNQGKLNTEELDQLLANYAPAIAALREQQLPEHAGLLLNFLLSKPASLLDYLAPKGLVVFDDWNNLLKDVKDTDEQNAAYIQDEVAGLRLAPKLKNQFD